MFACLSDCLETALWEIDLHVRSASPNWSMQGPGELTRASNLSEGCTCCYRPPNSNTYRLANYRAMLKNNLQCWKFI
jgi:hypothetical protein